jgi:hypothetical protein
MSGREAAAACALDNDKSCQLAVRLLSNPAETPGMIQEML